VKDLEDRIAELEQRISELEKRQPLIYDANAGNVAVKEIPGLEAYWTRILSEHVEYRG
jgi:hypothetical protein